MILMASATLPAGPGQPLYDRDAIQKCQDLITFCRRLIRCISGPRPKLHRVLSVVNQKLLAPITGWCARNSEHVSLCFVEPTGDTAKVFVVTRSEQYDPEFGTHLSVLNRLLLQSGCLVTVIQIPEPEPDTPTPFIPHDSAALIYANTP